MGWSVSYEMQLSNPLDASGEAKLKTHCRAWNERLSRESEGYWIAPVGPTGNPMLDALQGDPRFAQLTDNYSEILGRMGVESLMNPMTPRKKNSLGVRLRGLTKVGYHDASKTDLITIYQALQELQELFPDSVVTAHDEHAFPDDTPVRELGDFRSRVERS